MCHSAMFNVYLLHVTFQRNIFYMHVCFHHDSVYNTEDSGQKVYILLRIKPLEYFNYNPSTFRVQNYSLCGEFHMDILHIGKTSLLFLNKKSHKGEINISFIDLRFLCWTLIMLDSFESITSCLCFQWYLLWHIRTYPMVAGV